MLETPSMPPAVRRVVRYALSCGVAAAFAAAENAGWAQGTAAVATGPRCALTGTPAPSSDVDIHDSATGGRAIAHFSGAEIPVTESDFASDARARRTSIATGDGRGNFHLTGFVDSDKIPVFTTTRVSVVPDHVWIGQGRRVAVVGSDSDRLKIALRLTSPVDQTFSASASCGALGLTPATPPGWNVPGSARGYVVRAASVELFDTAGADRNVVTTLHRADGAPGILLWSTERRDAWVHVELHAEVLIDAWARARDLEALPEGETMDQLANAVSKRSSQHLALAGQPRVVRTTRQIPLRSKATDAAASIGWIEPDTDTYVIDTIAGWTSVLPRSLNVVPSGEGQFWVKASDLGGS